MLPVFGEAQPTGGRVGYLHGLGDDVDVAGVDEELSRLRWWGRFGAARIARLEARIRFGDRIAVRRRGFGSVVALVVTVGDPARWPAEIVAELAGHGVVLGDLTGDRDAPIDLDPLDVLLQVAWNVRWPQSVCRRSPSARSSAGNEAKDSRGRSLYRWHWHLDASPRVPKTVCRSSQLASLAGTTEIAGSVAVMRTILQVEWA